MKIDRPISKQPMPENAKRVFKGEIFDVYQWEQEGYDGKKRIFEKLKRLDSSLIIPITEDKKILLAKEEQPGKKPFVTTVGGRVEENEDPLEAAKRELLEETGFESDDWCLFTSVQSTSKLDWAIYTFIAKDCHKVAEQNLDGAEKIKLLFVNFDEFVEAVLREDFNDPELKIKLLSAKLDPAKMQEIKTQFGL
jgi:8-oxo-dGTP pyrophosphatase MutT (NUDIX family)